MKCPVCLAEFLRVRICIDSKMYWLNRKQGMLQPGFTAWLGTGHLPENPQSGWEWYQGTYWFQYIIRLLNIDIEEWQEQCEGCLDKGRVLVQLLPVWARPAALPPGPEACPRRRRISTWHPKVSQDHQGLCQRRKGLQKGRQERVQKFKKMLNEY